MNMNRMVWAVVFGLVAGVASAQTVTGLTLGGTNHVTTQVSHQVLAWRWSTGSGRGGGYVRKKIYYTTTVTDQSTSADASFALNASQSASTTNTFWNPGFGAQADAASTYSEANGVGTLLLSTSSTIAALPTVAGYTAAATATPAPSLSFYVPTGAEVSFTLSGSLAGSTQYSITSSSVDGDPAISYVGPNTYDLAGGYFYQIKFAPTALSGAAGQAVTGSLQVKMTFSPGPEIN